MSGDHHWRRVNIGFCLGKRRQNEETKLCPAKDVKSYCGSVGLVMGKSGGISEANVGSLLLLVNTGVLAWTTFIGLGISPLINVTVLGTPSGP